MTQLAEAISVLRRTRAGAEELEIVRKIVQAVADRLAMHDEIEELELYPLSRSSNIGTAAAAQLLTAVRRELLNMPPRFSGAE
jgi:hypothetical protein